MDCTCCSDAEAYALVERIGDKVAEVFDPPNPDKTVGDWRSDIRGLLVEAMEFTARRRRHLKTEE